ncbi:MAG: ABC transporter ATP-binding protein/permease [Bifidobacteriaceae bacterium]|jgi:ATP-binding cassette subfamily B protein|nr:ABC transporter ATP-binding protein/permease [Bifidobacteriaceae bacterium]
MSDTDMKNTNNAETVTERPKRGHGPTPGPRSVEKPKDMKGSLKRLVKYLTVYKFRMFIITALSVIATIFSIVAPKLLGNVTNVILDGIVSQQMTSEILKAKPPKVTDADWLANFDKDSILELLNQNGMGSMTDMVKGLNINLGHGVDFTLLLQMLGIVLGVYLLSFFLRWIMGWTLTRVVGLASYKIRSEIENKLYKLPLSYFDSNSRGDIMSRTTNDLDNVSNALQQTTQEMIMSVLQIIGVTVMMFTISPLLAAIALLVIPLSAIVAGLVIKSTQPQFTKQWRITGELDGHIEEAFTGHTVISLFKQEKPQVDTFNKFNDDLSEATFKAQFLSGLIQPFAGFISNLSYILVAVVGALRVSSGQLSLGDVQAFVQYSRQLSQPVSQVASMVNTLQSCLASAERLFQILDEPEETPDAQDAETLENVRGDVKFDNVNFSYSADTELIQNFNLVAQAGKTVAIVGPTGAGKTTLVNLIMRFYDVDSGKIEVDGHDIQRVSRNSLRTEIGMVLQDVWLFSGTIEENLRYGLPHGVEISDDELMKVTKATNVDSAIRKLPNGYQTLITNENDSLSEGEKQLLTIARASLANPRILILDEATSSVDTRTEVLVQKAMKELSKNRTSFVIAHRLSTIRSADTILLLQHGKITEQGSHDELIKQGGEYAKLYNAQFSGVDE